MGACRIDVAALIVEEEVGLEGLKEGPFVEAAEEHGLVDGDVPLHQRAHRALMGGGQAIMIDPATGALLGASDSRKDGLALGY